MENLHVLARNSVFVPVQNISIIVRNRRVGSVVVPGLHATGAQLATITLRRAATARREIERERESDRLASIIAVATARASLASLASPL